MPRCGGQLTWPGIRNGKPSCRRPSPNPQRHFSNPERKHLAPGSRTPVNSDWPEAGLILAPKDPCSARNCLPHRLICMRSGICPLWHRFATSHPSQNTLLHDLQPLVGHMGGRPIRRAMQLSGFSYQHALGLYRFSYKNSLPESSMCITEIRKFAAILRVRPMGQGSCFVTLIVETTINKIGAGQPSPSSILDRMPNAFQMSHFWFGHSNRKRH
jgi:hypothetical protein